MSKESINNNYGKSIRSKLLNIAKSEDIPFSKVIAYLQKYLLPYWNYLNQ